MAQLIATGRVAPEKLITHRYHGMEQIIDAMNLFLNHDRSLIKPVIYNDWAAVLKYKLIAGL